MRNLACLLLVWLVGCTEAKDQLAVPRLEEPVTLSVLVVSNPALPDISDARVSRILEEAAREARATFGTRIVFSSAGRVDIKRFFARFDPEFEQLARSHLAFDFKGGRGDVARLSGALQWSLERSGSPFDALYRYAQPYLLFEPSALDVPGLSMSATRTHLARLERLRQSVLASGAHLITDEPFNEYVYWGAAGRYPMAADVVVTNQILASAEYRNAELHSALRGGITNGLTAECVDCKYGTYVLLSTYAFWGEDSVTQELRGGHALKEDEAVRAAALLLVHELGHQLFHYGHPYAQSSCVMSPTRLLLFREWSRVIRSDGCVFGSTEVLRPGYYKFRDLRALQDKGVPLLTLWKP